MRPRGYRRVALRMRFRSPAVPHRGRSRVSEAPPGLSKVGQSLSVRLGPRGVEDLRGPDSGWRNASLRGTNCSHHVGRRRRFRPSASLTAVAHPPGRALLLPRPFLPVCDQSGVGLRRCPAPALCPPRLEPTDLSAHDPLAPPSLLLCPWLNLVSGRSPVHPSLE